MEFLCELYEAQTACGCHFVHELTSDANSRMKCVTKIMAMLGTRTTVADLCMFGLDSCDEGGPGFVRASVRTITNARQVGMRVQSKCTGTHRHVRSCANSTSEKFEQTGTWVHQVGRAMEEQLRQDQQELMAREQKKRAKDAKRIRGIVHANKGTCHVQNEMGKLTHHDEQELLSLWEGWHWDDKKGGWLDLELCAKATNLNKGSDRSNTTGNT